MRNKAFIHGAANGAIEGLNSLKVTTNGRDVDATQEELSILMDELIAGLLMVRSLLAASEAKSTEFQPDPVEENVSPILDGEGKVIGSFYDK